MEIKVTDKTVAVVGAGRVGVAVATLLSLYTPLKVVLIEADRGALDVARGAGDTLGWAALEFRLCESNEFLTAELEKLAPGTVVCCTPFNVNVLIAEVCSRIGANYVDFTEDVSVTKAVAKLDVSSSFVLQTGLAPGLVTSVGMALLEKLRARKLEPTGLTLRVGALPLVASMPSAYALTWSSSGLVNEYYQPVERIAQGELMIDEPLDDLEEFIVDGQLMEAFNTSGGLGSPSMYAGLSTADYKTMRYPGHLDFLQKKFTPALAGLSGMERIEYGVQLAESLFKYTRDDVVYMVVRAYGTDSQHRVHEVAFQHKFYGVNGMTALELTTAGTGAAVVELMHSGALPAGVTFGGLVPLEALYSTAVGSKFLGECMSKI